MSQIAQMTAANAIAQLTLPLIEASVLPQINPHDQPQGPPATKISDTVTISAEAAALQTPQKS